MLKSFLGTATIFTLHRVHPEEADKLSPNENMKVSPAFLERFILEAKEKGYSFLSLDQLENQIRENKSDKNLVMTIDDGYADNYQYAYPIFKKHNVPFAIYLTTSFPEKKAVLWWYVLEDLLLKNNSIKLSDSSIYNCNTTEEKAEAFLKIREKIIALPPLDLLSSLQSLFSHHPTDWTQKVNELALSWEQIELMGQDPLVTFGVHTSNHYALNSLSEEQLITEIVDCKKMIEAHTYKPAAHFCYPFGSSNEVGEREVATVKRLGFKTATTTRYGHIFSEHLEHLEALPRMMLQNDFSWTALYWRAIKRVLRGRRVAVL